MTAREVAMDLIRAYVERGDSVDDLASSSMGHNGPDYVAQIGGWLYRDFTVHASFGPASERYSWSEARKITNRQIGVTQVGNTSRQLVFPLIDIYNAVKAEIDAGGVRQLALF